MRWVLLVLLSACTPFRPVQTARLPPLEGISWLVGRWKGPLFTLHWQEVAGALYGIVLTDEDFEMLILDCAKPLPSTLVTLLDGRVPMSFTLKTATSEEVVFEGEDAVPGCPPSSMRFTRTPTGMRGETAQPPDEPFAYELTAVGAEQAPELEGADRQFAEDTARDGAEGWARHFAADGAMGNPRIEGDAIRATMGKRLAQGPLAWTPVASGARGRLGFTLGTWTFGAPATEKGSYATVWKKQPDGPWKVVFDIGGMAP
jgi:hypothetical protein